MKRNNKKKDSTELVLYDPIRNRILFVFNSNHITLIYTAGPVGRILKELPSFIILGEL